MINTVCSTTESYGGSRDFLWVHGNILLFHWLLLLFRLEIAFTGKTVGIMAKSSKTLQDALSAVLQKHNLKPQDASVTIVSVFVHERAYNRYRQHISSQLWSTK